MSTALLPDPSVSEQLCHALLHSLWGVAIIVAGAGLIILTLRLVFRRPGQRRT